MEKACGDNDIALYYPGIEFCTDNAAMIGAAAYYKYMELGADDLDMDALPNLKEFVQ
jgi:N6-L-threonylcarbamoyladenine synthase